MTQALLFVLHGRRDHIPASNIALLHELATRYRLPYAISFLEGDQQTLEDGATALISQADKLIVVPVLLFAATHVLWDIPRRLTACVANAVSTTILDPLGTTAAVTAYLSDQFVQAQSHYANRTPLIVTHGTPHFDEPLTQLASLAMRVGVTIGKPVRYASLIGPRPIASVLTPGTPPLLVLPLFLTNGRLVNRVKTQVRACQPDSVFLPPLEDEPVIAQAITQRLTRVGIKPQAR
ncbi:sirohydrochlorin chelatase [Lacticaseibacillus sp. GG6-2]